jgi:hypothetical protein
MYSLFLAHVYGSVSWIMTTSERYPLVLTELGICLGYGEGTLMMRLRDYDDVDEEPVQMLMRPRCSRRLLGQH